MRKRLTTGVAALAMLAALGGAAPEPAAPAYDVIIRSGTIVDGSGTPGVRGDVAIRGGYVVAVGTLDRGATAGQTIDATGLIVAPGFINLHSHADANAVPTALNMLVQGVTTEIINADGFGSADLAEQMPTFVKDGLAVNIGAYVGFNYVWGKVVGLSDTRPTPAQTQAMRGIVEKNLAWGAWGVSSGLDYRPSYYAKADEVVAVVSVAKPWRTNFPNHDRLRPEDGWSSNIAVAETIAIGEKAGIAPEITHIKSQGHERGQAGRITAMMAAATKRGAYTSADLYPYLAGHTALSAFFVPGWAAEGGRDAMLARFKDPAARAKVIEAAETALGKRFGGPENVMFVQTGRTLRDEMATSGAGVGETIVRLLEVSEQAVILTFGSEADVETFLRYPDITVSCDCGASTGTKVHPRYWGTFPRVFGEYVRKRGVISVEEAVRKMTALPATVIGMVDRGYLAPGMRADVTLFDPRTIADHATYRDPTLPPDGVRHVFVNGVQVLRDGRATGAKPGTLDRRSAHMPTRPMTRQRARSIGGAGASAAYRVSFALSQAAGARTATGTIALTESASGKRWSAARVGVLQTAPGWGSVTAVLRDAQGSEVPVTLTVDHAGTPGGKPVVMVTLAGKDEVELTPGGALTLRP